MRAALFLITLPIFFDITPGSALRKLAEQKTYAFTVQLKIDGEIGGGMRELAVPITAVVQKPDVMAARQGQRGQLARRGGAALFEDGGEWQTQDELEKAYRQANAGQQGFVRPHPLDPLMNLVTPYEVIARRGGLAKQKATEKAGNVDCTVFLGPIAKDAAADIAKSVTKHIPAGGAPGGPPGGGGGNYPSGGGGGGSLTARDVTGTAKLFVDTAGELPVQLVETVKFKVTVPRQGGSGQSEEQDVTITRTWTLSQFGAAKVELPAEVKKRLAIKD